MALRASAPTTRTSLCSALPSLAASQPSGQRGYRPVPRQPALAASPVARDAPGQRCASTGEGVPGRGQLVRRPGPGQRHPQDWRGRCRRATLASPARPQGSPAGYRLCAARVFHRDCHERVPWYAAHPPVSTLFLPATIAVNDDPAWRDTIRPLKNTGRSHKRRYGVHKRRRHQQRKRARAAQRKAQTPVDCARRLTPLLRTQ